MNNDPLILAIESSCDETSAAVLKGTMVLSNIIASQKIHEKYGGVVPELASRAHQVNIVPVVHQALLEANFSVQDIEVIACTAGPGLNGALLVGMSYAKSLALALNKPFIAVDHMKAHVMAHFLHRKEMPKPRIEFPMLCLTVSGGHTQIVLVESPHSFKIVGQTIDDAAGEAFDKGAKILGLPYPGGPMIDKQAALGNEKAFSFTIPSTKNYDYSFSGLKTSLLYFVQQKTLEEPHFISAHLNDICASFQWTIITYLLQKFKLAIEAYQPKSIALAGGVSANSMLRMKFAELTAAQGLDGHIPPFEYTTDNAAMIGAVGYFEYLIGRASSLDATTTPRLTLS